MVILEINTELKRISGKLYLWEMMHNHNISKERQQVNFSQKMFQWKPAPL